jgi:hypothetical protein
MSLQQRFFSETGEEAMYRKESSDYHTLRYVKWLEDKNAALIANQIKGRCKDCKYLYDPSSIAGECHHKSEIHTEFRYVFLTDYCSYFTPKGNA